jgi:hypothetical protein
VATGSSRDLAEGWPKRGDAGWVLRRKKMKIYLTGVGIFQ